MTVKILVVEDNEMNRDMLIRRLKNKGFETDIAVDGEHAIKMTQQYQPDIVLMDMSLPIMDGWQATHLLKNNKATQHIPIIGLSAHAGPGDIEKSQAAGCDEYETKPIDFPKLIDKIHKLLNLKDAINLP